jgi:hypothetical protein
VKPPGVTVAERFTAVGAALLVKVAVKPPVGTVLGDVQLVAVL